MSASRVFGAAVAVVGAASFCAALGTASLVAGSPGIQNGATQSGVPPSMTALYQQAALACPGLPWTVLAAIGTVESSNGTSNLPGVHSGANYAGAEGPMQFEPPTFAEYDQPIPPGGVDPPSPYDPVDAVYAASRLLCANGAANGADIPGAVFAYNHSQQYVDEVLSLARTYSQG